MGFRVRVWGLGFRVWGLGFRVSSVGFRASSIAAPSRDVVYNTEGTARNVCPTPTTARVNSEKLEHGFRRIGARIPYTLP